VAVAGIADADAGVAAGFLAALLFTIHLTIYMIAPPFGRPER
jgi:hypothetical protein